jgi:hypothetical protein
VRRVAVLVVLLVLVLTAAACPQRQRVRTQPAPTTELPAEVFWDVDSAQVECVYRLETEAGAVGPFTFGEMRHPTFEQWEMPVTAGEQAYVCDISVPDGVTADVEGWR